MSINTDLHLSGDSSSHVNPLVSLNAGVTVQGKVSVDGVATDATVAARVEAEEVKVRKHHHGKKKGHSTKRGLRAMARMAMGAELALRVKEQVNERVGLHLEDHVQTVLDTNTESTL